MAESVADEVVYLGPDGVVDINSFSFKREELSIEEFLHNKFREMPSVHFDAYQSLYAALRMFGKLESQKEWQEARWNWLDYRINGTNRESGGAIYGKEEEAEKIMTYLKNACEDIDIKSRFLLLYGPPSSAKTNIIKIMSDTLMGYRTFPQGTRYTVEFNLEGFEDIFGGYQKMKCPANDMPLKFVNKKNLEELLDEVNAGRAKWQEISVEPTICAHCRKVMTILKNKDVSEEELLNRIRVINLDPLEDMTVFELNPTDEKAYDSEKIFGGKINIDRLSVFKNKNNPLVTEFGMGGNIDGPCAQGGIGNFSEMIKTGAPFLNQTLDLIQNRMLVINNVYKVGVDMVILGTSNIEEFEGMKGLPTLGNYLLTRARIIPVGHPIAIDDYARALNERIFNKKREAGDIHVPPYFVETLLSTLGVVSTLEEPKSDIKLTLMQKAMVYNGEVPHGIENSLLELLDELKGDARSKPSSQLKEGMDGLPFRFYQDLPSLLELKLNRLRKNINKENDATSLEKCYSRLEIKTVLQDLINTVDGLTDECRERCRNELGGVVELYEKKLSRDVQITMLGEVQMLNTAATYLAMSHASSTKRKKVTIGGVEQTVNDDFLDKVEKVGSIKNSNAFRQSIAANMTHRIGDFKNDTKLLAKDLLKKNSQFREVISEYMARHVLPQLVNDISLAYSDSNLDVISKLIEKQDYCKSCAGAAISVANKHRGGKK